MPVLAADPAHADIAQAIAGFAALHPMGAGLCAFALMAVFAAGVRAFVRRTARREAWEMIVQDRKLARTADPSATFTYRDAVLRQAAGG